MVDLKHTEKIATDLEKAIADIQQEKQRLQAEIEERIADLSRREELVTQAIRGLRGETNGSSHPKYVISDKRLKIVQKYLVKHPKARQADIAAQLKLNSGAVSMAIRKLEAEGVVHRGEKENGSQTWIFVSDTSSDPQPVAA